MRTLFLFAVSLVLVAGLAFVVSSSQAQELFGSSKPAKTELFTPQAKPVGAPRIPNFDVRLSGLSLKDQLRKSSLTDVDSAINDTAAVNRTSIEAAVEELKRKESDVEVNGSV